MRVDSSGKNAKRVNVNGVLLCICAAAAACGGAPRTMTTARVAAKAADCRGSSAAKPIGSNGTSGTIALARIGDKRVALVADEDAKAILTFDTDSRRELAVTPLGGAPAHLVVAADGRIFVTLREKNEIAVLRARQADQPLEPLCATDTSAEPIAIALSPDERTAVVTSGWGKKVAVIDTATLASRYDVEVAREPRAVVVAGDGRRAFVSHAVGGIMSVLDLETRRTETVALRGRNPNEALVAAQMRVFVEQRAKSGANDAFVAQVESRLKRTLEGRPSCQGFVLAKSAAVPGRIFAPQVFVDPGDPSSRPTGYGDQNTIPETPSVAVIDESRGQPLLPSIASAEPIRTWSGAVVTGGGPPDCLLPRAAAVDAATRSLLVTCLGSDAVVAYDATSASPATSESRHWIVGSGPTGIAIDPDRHEAVVFSQFDRTISTFDIGDPRRLTDDRGEPAAVRKTALAPLAGARPEVMVGRMLFHAAGDPRISSDGRACASCHPDGRDDAITWATPEGPRRSILLAGRVRGTGPYSWDGNAPSVENHLTTTFERLKGKGLKGFELDALTAYVSSLPAPPPRTIADEKNAERGKQIFASREAGCSGCHAGAYFTDGQNHDVGSKDAFSRRAVFNTPSLRAVGTTGPWFHDGRYATLGELLRKSDGAMGHTKHLTDADLQALESFLRTL